MIHHPHLLQPDWLAPQNVRALVTLRHGGVSLAPFDSLNLGDHVGDYSHHVAANRQLLAEWAGVPLERWQWLRQVHGVRVVEADPAQGVVEADAVTTDRPGVVCVVMTADCLPVFFCDGSGSRVAVAHAGWRGLASGVLEATVATFDAPSQVLAWLGPAIGPDNFEVGPEVREVFLDRDRECERCFRASPQRPGYWLADLYGLTCQALHRQGVRQVSGGGFCTLTDADRFFSYRRDGHTGRMASAIWLQN